MNGLLGTVDEIKKIKTELSNSPSSVEVLICPPVTLLNAVVNETQGTEVSSGAQDCHHAVSGAHTGDISAEMLKEAGAEFVIVGHSERRADHGETDTLVKQKAEAALRAGLMPIVCVGETREEREAGKAVEVVSRQLKGSLPKDGHFVVAYEPVWAIGTGLVPTIEDITEIHAEIRKLTSDNTRILYGGSVKPGNAGEILAVENVNGALVGGASLKAQDFLGIIRAA